MQYFWCQTGAVALGFLLDLIFGDPHWLYHPVQLIGSLISKLEKVLQALRGYGIEKLVMLTGDRPESADVVAKELHLDEYRAGLLPEGKAAALESLGAQQSVLFVGDGINDAPVLAMSGVGVAMGGLGSEAAIEVADAVILDDSPSRLPELFSIAAKTRVVVWQNIFMALGIKGLFMVLGVVGLSGLWEAVFADVGVALLAVLNATRTAR